MGELIHLVENTGDWEDGIAGISMEELIHLVENKGAIECKS